jgi:WD40 repeat protein
MEEVLNRILTLEKKVAYLESSNNSLIQEINHLKEAKYQTNIDKLFTSINLYKQTPQQHKYPISSLLELLDGKIVLGCGGGAMSLNQINYETKEWKIIAQFNNAHNGPITCLCELNDKRVISSSYDKFIKIWNISSNSGILLIQTLTQHKEGVLKLLTLTCNRFASCSYNDGEVKLWDNETYQQIPTPFEQQVCPTSLLQLNKQREVLVISSCPQTNPSLRFYQLQQPFNLIGIVENVCTTHKQGLIELTNGHVAASRHEPNHIYIIDPQTYRLVTTIMDSQYIPIGGPLYCCGNDSFIYVPYSGKYLCQISMINGEYKISFKGKENENSLKGNCMSMINNGKFIISSNNYGGCSIFNYSCV